MHPESETGIGVDRVFDRISGDYDRWYDEPDGRMILQSELECLRSICANFHGRWLEVGVGTGRFASGLGIAWGLDPSLPMLRIAGTRGLSVCTGTAEALPFPASSMDGLLLALTLCFLKDPEPSFKEFARVLRPRGALLLGLIPAEGPWGRWYARKKAEGHPVYSQARFYAVRDVLTLAEQAGLELAASASTLFRDPQERPDMRTGTQSGIFPDAGFVGLLFNRMGEGRNRRR